MCQSIQNFNIRLGNLPGIWTFKVRPGQILLPSSAEAPAGYPIVPPLRFRFLSPQLPYDTERPLRRKEKFSLYITA